jgi:FixJ family two-component response regulator
MTQRLNRELPGFSGLDLQKRLAVDRKDMTIIFVTDHSDVAITVQVMKAGVFDFLAKLFCDDALLSAVRQTIERSSTALDHVHPVVLSHHSRVCATGPPKHRRPVNAPQNL